MESGVGGEDGDEPMSRRGLSSFFFFFCLVWRGEGVVGLGLGLRLGLDIIIGVCLERRTDGEGEGDEDEEEDLVKKDVIWRCWFTSGDRPLVGRREAMEMNAEREREEEERVDDKRGVGATCKCK